jgi:N-acetyl-anhydromuramyl-L-alanine amidase AmpD
MVIARRLRSQMELNLQYPPFIRAKYFTKGRIKPVQLIVIHTAEAPKRPGTAEAVARYFQNPPTKASAHYCVDNDSLVQCVWDRDTAYAVKNGNANGVSIELAGYANQTRVQWLDEYNNAMFDNAAQVCAYLCRKFNIQPRPCIFQVEN